MNGIDIGLLALVLAAVALAARACARMKRKTGSCCGNCAACGGCCKKGKP